MDECNIALKKYLFSTFAFLFEEEEKFSRLFGMCRSVLHSVTTGMFLYNRQKEPAQEPNRDLSVLLRH